MTVSNKHIDTAICLILTMQRAKDGQFQYNSTCIKNDAYKQTKSCERLHRILHGWETEELKYGDFFIFYYNIFSNMGL